MEKTWRISLEEYNNRASEIIKANETVQQWADISLNPMLDNKERMTRIMMNNDSRLPKSNYICQSYMCSVMTPSEEFLKDVIYVNSGLAIIGLWDDDIIDWVCSIYSICIDSDRSNTTAYTGNACKYVEDAVNDKKFANSCPEYHDFLSSKLIGKEELEQKILNYKGKHKTIEESIKYYSDAYDFIKKYQNYSVPVTNQLDWKLIPTFYLSSEFISKYKKVGGSPYPENKPVDPIVDRLDAKLNIKRKANK